MSSRLLLVIILLILPLVPTFWAILDIPRRRFSSLKKKIIWFLMVSSLPCVGALLYLALARRHTEPSETFQE
jgi:hypothetical protein